MVAHIFIDIHVHVHSWLHTYTCTYRYTYIIINISIYIDAYTYTYLHVYMHTWIHLYTCTYIYRFIYLIIYLYTHIHTRYIYIPPIVQSAPFVSCLIHRRRQVPGGGRCLWPRQQRPAAQRQRPAAQRQRRTVVGCRGDGREMGMIYRWWLFHIYVSIQESSIQQ